MTGLDPGTDRILEMATLVTDKDLAVVATGPAIVIHQAEKVLARMDTWNVEHHGRSGLIEEVRASTIDEAAAEAATLEFLRSHVPDRVSPMCGNSICQDRRFLAHYMPLLEAYFHYRQIDVSTLKELARRWAPALGEPVQKESAHRALDDIRESLTELRQYREILLRPEFGGRS